jgi:outer membrane receptor protein involved in Fe transport
MTTIVSAQSKNITISGSVKDESNSAIPFVNIIVKSEVSEFISGTVSDEEGMFELSNIKPGSYVFEYSFVGYQTVKKPVFIGAISEFLNLPVVSLKLDAELLNEVKLSGNRNAVSNKMDKKTFAAKDNLLQNGGSVLQALQNLPGVTTNDSKIELRGSDKVIILIDGKQTALTGFGAQKSLDNLPASSIERIEIINSPSAKYDANGNAGIINIIYKKNNAKGFNGKLGFVGGLGALWERKESLPNIRPQYVRTPKLNPSVVLNYRKDKVNSFFQADYLYKETLNKNEFVTRVYDNEPTIKQQTNRNRDTGLTTLKSGIDWSPNESDLFTVSGFFSYEVILDYGDEPFFNEDLSERQRLWSFLEDEIKTTAIASAAYEHKFKEAGHKINVGLNYTFHREDEKYFFDNTDVNSFKSENHFELLSDEHVLDFNFDYARSLSKGKIESGIKFRRRNIPTNMEFFVDSGDAFVDQNDGGPATYTEVIPAVYTNYSYENEKYEAELGVRVEYVDLNYAVNPNHSTYESDGYSYTEPFPNMRLAYKLNESDKLSFFYNRRVDRPTELDIRIFPKFDDVEIVKVGNPNLKPQFTNVFELGYKNSWNNGYLYSAVYHKIIDETITRIAVTDPGTPNPRPNISENTIYNVFHNADRSYNSGVELVLSQKFSLVYSFNLNTNIYKNSIDAFEVNNLYPNPSTVRQESQEIVSGNIKANNLFHFKNSFEMQVSAVYLAADIIPQGKVRERYSLEFGLKKTIQKGKGEIIFNASDLLNTMVYRKDIDAGSFSYSSADYKETQVFRLGYNYKF